MKLVYDVQDKPPFKKTLVFAFQQMIAIMAATLLVPILVSSYGLPTDVARLFSERAQVLCSTFS